MAFTITMPQLGLTMTEGAVGKWLKKIGDPVTVGEPVVEIETDKLATEVISEAEGVLLAIVADAGDDVPVRGVLGYIGQAGEALPGADALIPAVPSLGHAASASPAAAPPIAPGIHRGLQAAPVPVTVPAVNGRVKASPLAKKTASALGVTLAGLAGSGPGGRILQRDVMAASAVAPVQAIPASGPGAAAPAALAARREKLTGMRKIVGERMCASHSRIPPVTQTVKVDVTGLLELRAQCNAGRGKDKRFSLNDFVLKATAGALSRHKEMLVSLEGDEIVHNEDVHIGMAVALDEGLIVPVIRNADRLGLEALSAKAGELTRRAREGRLGIDEYAGSTFSVSNLGMFGVETFTPIINQPNAAILGVCAVDSELDMDEEGTLFKKRVMRFCLTYDHRLLDGAVAARFQATLRELLQNPVTVLL